ncbi:hypothetical protein GLOIN_2v1493963 [Rhizophagus irregularis DAOM 181602=DAOM 197198]|uniref:Uncharacterized protein n=1 Tax=Rhizophagus irregularis (strain DAOM 181602 / DAOM 197198 / MUCL 43194) TaxID=747089 RepID=A0A2P4QYU1_RHIID|nr:hypothetical protein GLOIN_2v1493963 [Rhizophagus irregularis DAOM 181602=DAOM 197198]POG82823.1 hypothetical protein GLOIN_2v1493963 [Rhizophagus irregularis DAOM 181602=DAOM 197198]|eukprot:XP_025189689.1 hypothetical protein GLOIN_2v1493963 [Rhizophagus irregularis DAOM 181602=DAOM 197198]
MNMHIVHSLDNLNIRILKAQLILADQQGNPWPTIIAEVANSESLSRIIHMTTQFWLAPNRVEDVDQNGTPLRRFTVQYCFFCCHFIYFICLIIVLYFGSAINSVVQQAYKLQNVHGNYQPVQIIEFGTIDRNNQPYNGCTAAGMCIMNIFPGCIFRGYPQVPPYPINNVVIDFFPIQQAIFRAM